MDTLRAARSFLPLDSQEQLDALLAQSHQQPVVIFKHSPACGTSAQAFDDLEGLLQQSSEVAIHLVDVLTRRGLSQAIAARFGVRHESPQLFIVRNGEVRWHGSHWRVNADDVRRALAQSA